MVDREHPSLSLIRQCSLLGVTRSGVYPGVYYRRKEPSAGDLSLMREKDRQYLKTPSTVSTVHGG